MTKKDKEMNSVYPIFCFDGPPVYDALPVLKITHYPFETADYKPFAQGLLCMTERQLVGRLWAFEARPEGSSGLALALEGPTGRRFSLSLGIDGSYTATLDGQPCPLPALRPSAGEDLQGEYWGVDIALSENLTAGLGIVPPYQGLRLRGNIYKFCPGVRPHFGSYAPISDRDITATPALFELVPY